MGVGVGWEVGVALGHFMQNKAWQDLACLLKKKVCVCGGGGITLFFGCFFFFNL